MRDDLRAKMKEMRDKLDAESARLDAEDERLLREIGESRAERAAR